MRARIRVVWIIATILTPVLSGCGSEREDAEDEAVESHQEALSTDAVIYTDHAPVHGWASWSWSSSIGLANADAPLASSGSGTHIRVTSASSGGALSLAHGVSDLTAADYDAVTFDVRAPSASTVRLSVQTLAGTSSGVETSVTATPAWTRRTVALSELQGSLARFGKINWGATRSGQTFYVDNVRLVAKSSGRSDTYPTAPIEASSGSVVTLRSSVSDYSVYVPSSYDATHRTPTKVLVWLHGCGGNAYGDAWATSPGGTQSWISVSVGGRDGTCWNMGTDVPMVLAALDDVKRRLNVDPRRVVIGGYSSGGNLAYRTAFYNARRFAGIIAENTGVFQGTGSSQSASIAAAAWKLNVAHLAHVSDTTFAIDAVRAETNALKNAGFPTRRIERPGSHWDPDTGSSGTNHDLRNDLLRYLDAGWAAP